MDLVSQGETCNVLKKKIFQINLNDIDNNNFISLLNEIDDSKVINLFTKLEERFLLDIFSKLFEVFRSKDKRNYIISYNVGLDIISKTNEWSCVSYVNVIKESLKRNESKNERE